MTITMAMMLGDSNSDALATTIVTTVATVLSQLRLSIVPLQLRW
uniref:Uncharacterized protein n=1 Tax=Brugia malayi TaxID=6279 RepID=A8PKS8_BRUMA